VVLATDLTGTFHKPDGTPVSGKLIFLLSQPARLSDNSAQVVPMVKIFTISNGQLEPGAFIYGNDALTPAGTHYLVRLVDDSNNLLFEQKWSIQGATLDLGTMTPTTTGVVLPDPLVKNVTTDQSVQGPVTFSSGITTVSLLLSGNLGPSADGLFDLGSGASRWREIFAQQWAGRIQPGTTGGMVMSTASAPGLAQESTTGGAIADGTYYCVTTLVNLNGESTPTPEQSLVISAGTGTAQILAALTGNEWMTGAPWFKLYCGMSSGGPYFLQIPKAHTFTMDNNTVSRDANGFVNLTLTGTASLGLGVGYEITVAGATGCTNNPNGTFRVYSHTAVASPASSSVTFKHAGATESGCGGAAITVSWATGITAGMAGSATHLINSHLVRGNIILTGITLSGDQPPSTNTAAIDDVQVAINSARVAASLAAGQTPRAEKWVQLAEGNDQISGGKFFYGLTTPLVLSDNDRVRGVAGVNTDGTTTMGTMLWARSSGTGAGVNPYWNQVYDRIGAVMILNSNGTVLEDVNIDSETNGVFIFQSESDAEASANIILRRGVWKTSGAGTNAPAPLRTMARIYYLEVDGVSLVPATTTDVFATAGHPRCAALMMSHGAGSEWVFKGPVRWTVPAKCDFIQNRMGPTDPDRGVNRAGFTQRVHLVFQNLGHFQATAGGGTGVICRCENTIVNFNNSPGPADYNVSTGTDAAYIFGSNSYGSSGAQTFYKANLLSTANNAATIAFTNSTPRLELMYSAIGGTVPIINFNSFSVPVLTVMSDDTGGLGLCDPRNSTFFANRLTTPGSGSNQVVCLGALSSNTPDRREYGHYIQGGIVRQGFRANASEARIWESWAENGTGLNFHRIDPDTPSQRFMQWDTSAINFYGADGSTVIQRINKATGQVEFPNASGTPPFSVSSTAEIANLNPQLWRGKQALDFSAALDFSSIAAQSCAEMTIAASGAAVDNPIAPSWPSALEANLVGNMRVSAGGTVTVRLCNIAASAIDPASRTFAGRIIQ
jgi:hypothetical protein